MPEARERAEKLENQLSGLLFVVNREDFAGLYDGDVDKTKVLLEKYLTTLRTDMRQMSDVEEANFFAGDPRFDNVSRALIQDVETIGVELEFNINPKLESIAKQLAEKAEKAKTGDQGLLSQAFEALDKAIVMVAAPVAKAAALATAINTLVDFFQAMPK